jgi:hypothetical protein
MRKNAVETEVNQIPFIHSRDKKGGGWVEKTRRPREQNLIFGIFFCNRRNLSGATTSTGVWSTPEKTKKLSRYFSVGKKIGLNKLFFKSV